MNQGRRKTDVIDSTPVAAPASAGSKATTAEPVHPHAVLSASLVLSLLLWFPTLQACLDGDTTLVIAAIRYVVAFGFVRLALGGIVHLVHQYRAQLDLVPVAVAATEPAAGDVDEDAA